MCNDSRLIIASFEHYWNHCYCLSSTLSAAWVCTHAHKAHTHRHSPSYTCSEAVGSEFSICQHNHLVYLHIMVFSSTIWRNGSHEAKIKPTCTWMGIAPLLAETETRGSSEANLQSSNLKWVLIESITKGTQPVYNLYGSTGDLVMSNPALRVTGWVPSCWDIETALPVRAETDQPVATILEGSTADVFTFRLKTHTHLHCHWDSIGSFVIG